MAFNINYFKQNGLVYGGARPSLFQVIVTPPQGIGLDSVSVNKFPFVCRAAELPSSDVASFDVPYFGRKVKLAGDRTFTDWRVTVMNDEDFSVRSMFELWSNAINRLEANIRDQNLVTQGGGEQYKQSLIVQQFSKDGEGGSLTPIRSYEIIGAFPTSVEAISLDWNSTNSIEEFNVTFAYDYWLPVIEQSTKKAGGVNVYGDIAQQPSGIQ